MSIDVDKKSRRGRPRVDSDIVTARVARPILNAMDAWIAAQVEPRPTRPEVIRLALAEHLKVQGFLPAEDTASGLADQIGDLEQSIAGMPPKASPSPQAAMNTMRQALANDDLNQLKNRHTVARRRDKGRSE